MPFGVQENSVQIESPPVNVSGAVVVSISGNNQQFINDRTLHFRDKQNTFEYSQPFFIESLSPDSLSNAGSSPLRIKGIGFDQWKFDNGTSKNVPLYCRFMDPSTDSSISLSIQMNKVSDNEYLCIAQRYDFVGEAKVQLSANEQQWQTIENKVRFYNGPKVTKIDPTYGETKNPKGSKLEISGDNFICPGGECSKIKVRFQNERGDNILQAGTMLSTGVIQCTIPKYPAPETLNVDISFNGQDFTNDHV